MNLFDHDLETSIIGGVFARKSLTASERHISTVDFSKRYNSEIWSKILEQDEDGEEVDLIEVHRRCKDAANGNFPFSISEFTNFAHGNPGGDRPQDVKRLRQLADARRLQGTFNALANKLDDNADVVGILAEADHLLEVYRKNSEWRDSNARQLAEVLEFDVFPRLDKFVSGDTVKLPFGFQALDDSINGGVGLGELVILGAKPKQGKSGLVLQIAAHHATRQIPSLIVSREMLNFENGFRFLAQNSRFSNNVFRPNLMPQTAEELKEVGRSHFDKLIWLDDRSKKVSEIRRQVKLLRDSMGLQSVFVDYAQLVRPDTRKQSRADDLEMIYYDLKEMAQDYEVAVYCNAQFNRVGIKSERPTMADFDGSSAAEKAGNLIIIWQLQNEYSELDQGRRGTLWIEAGRNVATDEFSVVFQGKHSRFLFV